MEPRQVQGRKEDRACPLASVDVLDDYTVRLNLSMFDNVIVSHLATDAGRMISPTAFEKHGQAWCEKNPVGTGAVAVRELGEGRGDQVEEVRRVLGRQALSRRHRDADLLQPGGRSDGPQNRGRCT